MVRFAQYSVLLIVLFVCLSCGGDEACSTKHGDRFPKYSTRHEPHISVRFSEVGDVGHLESPPIVVWWLPPELRIYDPKPDVAEEIPRRSSEGKRIQKLLEKHSGLDLETVGDMLFIGEAKRDGNLYTARLIMGDDDGNRRARMWWVLFYDDCTHIGGVHY